MIKPIKPSLPRHTIMIADDEPGIIKFFRNILSREGYRVVSVRNGRDALKKAKKGGIDLVVLDIVMPGMDGMEALKELRRIAPRLAVIVLTGYGDLQTAREAMLLGARDYITKPFDVDFMRAAVKQALKRVASSTLVPPG
jgi:DNA-binding NtrC family response regulator